MKLREIAHARTGDKGEISNISVIPYNEEDFALIREQVTAERVKQYFREICRGDVRRYELPGLKAFNFVLDKTLGGGVTRSLAIDKHGKTLGMALLEMEIEGQSASAGASGQAPLCKKREEEETLSVSSPLKGKTIRIGSGAGYAGDRMDAAVELMEKGNLNYIIFECLAERTIALGQAARKEDPNLGYNALLEERMEKILPLAKEKHIKVITNMGAANPRSAAAKTIEIANRLGIYGLNIACVTGDDVYDQLSLYQDNTILENGQLLREFPGHFLSANAYTGADAITEALRGGADIVITGRVSDPALTVGPLVYEYGWDIDNNPAEMGQAILAGHLLECAGQVTGGYFADPGYKDVPELYHLGFPIIEMDATGKFTVSKVSGSGGCVTVDTCKEQTIYEIHDPEAYLTPDAVADFSHVSYKQLGKDLVLADGAVSHGRPATLKVSLGYEDCYIAEGEISYGGVTAAARAHLADEIIRKRLPLWGEEPSEFRTDYIGENSLYRDAISSLMTSAAPLEIRVRFSARYSDKAAAARFANDIETLYTNGPAGGGGATKKVTKVLSICSIFIPREAVHPAVQFISQMVPFPLKGVLFGFPMIGNVIKKHLPALEDAKTAASLPEQLIYEGLHNYFHMTDVASDAMDKDLLEAMLRLHAVQEREIAEFGVAVDENDSCHRWSNTDTGIQRACVEAIKAKYKGRKGEIVFYGPSNIQMWYSLEKDMLPYAAQNHGMGGCVDEEMIAYAPEMLYDFEPSVVFFQTGSNDLALGLTLEEILANKKRMYSLFLAKMPQTKLVVMSGLPLPGRQQFWADTVKTNALLKEMCGQMDRMYFMDATSKLMKNNGTEFCPEYYRSDGIHLNKAGHDVWTACMKDMLREIFD